MYWTIQRHCEFLFFLNATEKASTIKADDIGYCCHWLLKTKVIISRWPYEHEGGDIAEKNHNTRDN